MKLIILVILPTVTFALNEFICDQATKSLVCSTGMAIQIRSVNYGRTSQVVCKNNGNLNCYSSGRVTAFVAKRCNDQNACQLTADSTVLNEDPCPGIPKYLDVQYDCVPIPTTTTTTTPATTTQPQAVTHSSVASPNSGGPQVCHEYLISGTNGIPDNQLTASSTWSNSSNSVHAPYRARLFNTAKDYGNGTYYSGGWSSQTNDKNQYIQAELNSVSLIRGVVTQGRYVDPQNNCCHERTTKYKVMYSVDGSTWETIKDGNGNAIVFIGNTKDDDKAITNMFGCPIIAKFLRIVPAEWSSHVSLRFDLIGCRATTDPYGVCPKGWEERPGSKTCYLITSNQSKGWREARQACKLQQGDLVKIDSIQERDWLVQKLQTIQNTKFQGQLYQVWLGLNNLPRTDNKDYKWTDGSPLNTQIVPWKKGNPDNFANQEHCGEFANAELNDVNCNSALNFICEKPKFWKNPGTSSTQAPPTGQTQQTTQNSMTTPTSVQQNGGQTSPTSQPIVTPTKQQKQTPTTRSAIGATSSTSVPSASQSALSTGPIVIPVPSGQTATTINGHVFYTGCGNQNDCYNLGIGDHQYCKNCHEYLTCAPSGVFVRPCPANLEFDNNVQACVARSWTCRRVGSG